MAKKKRMTARERLLAQKRRQEEADRERKFKKRLVKVSITTRPFSLLHSMQIFYCGYCGKQMGLYSSRSIQIGSGKLPPLFYACHRRCQRSGYQRTEFIDKLVMQLIQRRIVENFPKPKSGGDYEKLLGKFSKLDEMHSKRLELLNSLHYASYKRNEILTEVNEVKTEIDAISNEIKKYFSKDTADNPLMFPLFEIAPNDVGSLDLAYRRELVKIMIRRLRYFNEFIITRMFPLTELDREKSDEMGRVFNINLRISDRGEGMELPDFEDVKKEIPEAYREKTEDNQESGDEETVENIDDVNANESDRQFDEETS